MFFTGVKQSHFLRFQLGQRLLPGHFCKIILIQFVIDFTEVCIGGIFGKYRTGECTGFGSHLGGRGQEKLDRDIVMGITDQRMEVSNGFHIFMKERLGHPDGSRPYGGVVVLVHRFEEVQLDGIQAFDGPEGMKSAQRIFSLGHQLAKGGEYRTVAL